MTKIGIVENDEKDMALLKNAIEEYYSKMVIEILIWFVFQVLYHSSTIQTSLTWPF